MSSFELPTRHNYRRSHRATSYSRAPKAWDGANTSCDAEGRRLGGISKPYYLGGGAETFWFPDADTSRQFINYVVENGGIWSRNRYGNIPDNEYPVHFKLC